MRRRLGVITAASRKAAAAAIAILVILFPSDESSVMIRAFNINSNCINRCNNKAAANGKIHRPKTSKNYNGSFSATAASVRVRGHGHVSSTTNPFTRLMPLSVGGANDDNDVDENLKSSAAAAAHEEGTVTGSGTATIPDEIFNLVKSLIGAGVLALPAGIAASFSGGSSSANTRIIIIPLSCFLITGMGIISAYTFSMIAYICRLTGATSYAQAWTKTMSGRGGDSGNNSKTAWIVSTSSALNCFAINLAYSMVLGDTVKDLLLATIGIVTTRSQALVGLTGLVLLPLCLIKNLSNLAPFSLVGILGMLYTSIAIGIRYLGGAYTVPTGKFVADLAPHLRPAFAGTSTAAASIIVGTGAGASSSSISSMMMAALFNPKCLILISMLSTAYTAHFNAPKFYRELKNNTPQRFNTVVAASFGISIAVYATVSCMAFLTFGTASAGLILNNYSTRDVLFSFSRFAVALSLIFSYPLIFVGLRDGILDLLQVPDDKRTNSLLNQCTFGLVPIITGLALKVTDLTFVTSMSGAVLGTSLIFIFPTLMLRAAVRNDPTKKWERRLCTLIAVIGVAVGGVGAKMALLGRGL